MNSIIEFILQPIFDFFSEEVIYPLCIYLGGFIHKKITRKKYDTDKLTKTQKTKLSWIGLLAYTFIFGLFILVITR